MSGVPPAGPNGAARWDIVRPNRVPSDPASIIPLNWIAAREFKFGYHDKDSLFGVCVCIYIYTYIPTTVSLLKLFKRNPVNGWS